MDAMDNGLEQRVERAAVGGPRYAQWLALGYLVGIVLCALVIYAEFRQIDRQIRRLRAPACIKPHQPRMKPLCLCDQFAHVERQQGQPRPVRR